MKAKILLPILLLFLVSFGNVLPPVGIENPMPIEPFLNHVFPTKSPNFSSWTAVNAFPNLTFVDPVAMVEIPNESAYFIAGKQGVVWRIEADANTTDKVVALDIKDLVITSEDAGLINLVLHPDFGKTNSPNRNFLYLFYAYHPTQTTGNNERMNRLSRFSVFDGTLDIDPDSEFILIQDYDPQGWHMGGAMFFDPKGFLYLGFGDGGDSGDIFNSAQQIDQRFWGGLIRIDVDNDATRSHPIRRQIVEYPNKPANLPPSFSQGYMIPNDNPWQDEAGNILEEFYALGLRSPHRGCYDSVEQKIWLGDVGQAKQEEINVIPKGGNLQWSYKEGTKSGPRSKPDSILGIETPPIYRYGRTEGNSIIGGFVYRGDQWSQYLDGRYIFGDHGTRHIWSFNPTTTEVTLLTTLPEFGEGSKSGISSFATNKSGDIFALKLYGEDKDGGVIYKLKINNAPSENIPTLLSQTGAFSDLENLTPTSGLVPYEVNSPLWSDGAIKKRWIALPNDGTHDTPEEQIIFSKNDNWQFPEGTVFIKHFELPLDANDPTQLKKLETRFFIIDKNGRGYGLTYRWNEAGTDATFQPDGSTETFDVTDNNDFTKTQTWDYPSSLQCMNCHNANAEFILGAKTWQLNGKMIYPTSGIEAHQLETWNHLEMFANPIATNDIDGFLKSVGLSESTTLAHKVNSYLDSNCAHCHQPNGVESAFDARFNTPMAQKNIINALGVSHNNPTDGKIVIPQFPEHSQLWIRDNSLDDNKMPPVSKALVDTQYMAVLTDWINSLNEDCFGKNISDLPWKATPINAVGTVEINQSNGEGATSDGQPIRIAGKAYQHGLGVHADSEVVYDLEKKYTEFNTYIGVDDESCELASLRFEIFVDGKMKFRSPIMHKGEAARFVSIDVKNSDELKLVVTSPFDHNACDHADWAAPQLIRFADADGDGVCDNEDRCPGGDDQKDYNNNGIPDDCEVDQEESTIEVRTMPNPFTNYIEVELVRPDPIIQKAALSVFDMNGRLMYQDFNVAYDARYRIGKNWHAGMYIVIVKAGSFSNQVKIIKQ